MLHLFTSTFFHNQANQTFSVYKLADNLYQARSDLDVIILWKKDNKWEGEGNTEEVSLIGLIGTEIDKHLSTIHST
jgi:hypothetical protein